MIELYETERGESTMHLLPMLYLILSRGERRGGACWLSSESECLLPLDNETLHVLYDAVLTYTKMIKHGFTLQQKYGIHPWLTIIPSHLTPASSEWSQLLETSRSGALLQANSLFSLPVHCTSSSTICPSPWPK